MERLGVQGVRYIAAAVLLGLNLSAGIAAAAETAQRTAVDGLSKPVLLSRDGTGVVHVTAPNEKTMVFAQGYVHARDRLFQMDVLRRTASGTLAELLGPAAIPDDVVFRTIGLRRAAEKTWRKLDPPLQQLLTAYARGVNAYRRDNLPPPEYTPLRLGGVAEWTPIDTLAIAKLISFQLSADLDDIDRTQTLLAYQGTSLGAARGAALFFEDTWRVAPFEPIATVPASSTATPTAGNATEAAGDSARATVMFSDDGALAGLSGAWQQRLRRTPILAKMLAARETGAGSNAFVVAGRLTRGGRPLLANDPHLDLGVPSLFYPIQLRSVADGIHVRGASFAGVPYAAQGVNQHLAWGATTSGIDVTDVYEEELVPDPASPSGQSTLYQGNPEPVLPIPQEFRANVNGTLTVVPVDPADGGVTLIVPRRNNGPIIQRLGRDKALSLQWAGSGESFEIAAFREISFARSRAAFEAALQHFDVGSQNFLYADRTGTIAYYLSGEVPLREDLQANQPQQRPPFLIRSGAGGQEWMPLSPLPKDQALPFVILPFAEMPRAVNPAAGYLINANNDPTGDTFDNNALNTARPGGGIRYLGADFNPGLRAHRIDTLIRAGAAGQALSFAEMQAIQADVVLDDARVFVCPHILRAFDAVSPSSHPELQALRQDPGIIEAVGRLRHWQFSTPTGVREGFDAVDRDGVPLPMPAGEVSESIAATIYAFWRSAMVANTIDATLTNLDPAVTKPRSRYAIRALRNLLDQFPTQRGIGKSGLDFLTAPVVLGNAVGADAATRLDVIILRSLRDALYRLASADLAPVFGGSTRQADYRWGRLHRLTIDHPLGDDFSFTSPTGPFPPPFAGLKGIPIDGGFETVDRATHDVRAALPGRSFDEFLVTAGPIDRFVVRLGGPVHLAENALPGGVSGVPGSPHYADLLGPWLTNDAFRFAPCSGGCGQLEILTPRR